MLIPMIQHVWLYNTCIKLNFGPLSHDSVDGFGTEPTIISSLICIEVILTICHLILVILHQMWCNLWKVDGYRPRTIHSSHKKLQLQAFYRFGEIRSRKRTLLITQFNLMHKSPKNSCSAVLRILWTYLPRHDLPPCRQAYDLRNAVNV